ncbi:MAG TPA: hypothetical protein VM029_22560 [Opitutaceae bacterium]|nr:hypothetical protein [Opitutaceae bacterium]
MKRFPSFPGLAAIVLLAAAPLSGPAADSRPTTSPQPTITLDFPGGSVASLMTQVGRMDHSFMVMGEKADMAAELPPFALRNAEPGALGAALNIFLNARGFELKPGSGHQNTVYVLRKMVPGAGGEQTIFDSFQLAPFLESQSIDDITGAIRTAWEMNPAHKPTSLQLKYHPATSILLASGTPEALEVVRRVLGVLKRSDPKPKAAPYAPVENR